MTEKGKIRKWLGFEKDNRQSSNEISAPTKQVSLHHWKFSKVHTAFKLPYIYDYITKLCRQQAEVIQNHENEHVRGIGQGKRDIENIRGLNLAVVKVTTVQVTISCRCSIRYVRYT
jgi:hypothetical protein